MSAGPLGSVSGFGQDGVLSEECNVRVSPQDLFRCFGQHVPLNTGYIHV